MSLKINVLGTGYTIKELSEQECEGLKNCDGFCDKTIKEIVISKKPDSCDLGDWEWYRKKILRHEIIHAFLFESGLHENWEHNQYGQEETTVDWIAIQFPKMLKVFQEADCL